VPAGGSIQSPVLIGRDDFVALAGRRLGEAAAGAGQLLFVAGEAGIGKTRLLGSIARHAQASGFAVVRAAAFPGDVQSFAGLLLDLAGDLTRAPAAVLSELGRSLSSRVRTISAATGDAHHRRRLLVQDVVDLLVSAEPGGPVLMILEDLHWADSLSIDVRGAAALVPRMVAVAHLLGEGLDARVITLQAAMDSLDGVAGADRERARLRSAMAAAFLMDDRLDEAIGHGERSRAESQRIGDDEAALNTEATLGSVLVLAGRMDEGWRLLEGAVARATSMEQEAEAARGYRMIGSSASVLVEYDRAEWWLAEGAGYAGQVELWNHRHYMAAHLAHVQWATGQWDVAARTAEQVLADGRGGITTRITALYVLGYLAMGRGDWDAAAALLGEALAAGEQMGELQRLSPPLWGLAEAARCQGDTDTALLLCERGYTASADVTDAAYLFPYLLTGVRAHLARGDADTAEAWARRAREVLAIRAIPGTLPAIGHAQGLILLARGDVAAAHGALQSACEAWQARRRFWEGTWACLDLAAAAARARRRGEAARLADTARVSAAQAGAAVLVRAAGQLAGSLDGGRPADPWHPLSEREFEVAQLVAAGLTNPQIAARLVLAPKTISAHVSHILTKLGAARRTEIAAWCAAVRQDPPDEH